jgi:hypothetical protein
MPSDRLPPIPSVAHYKAALIAARGQLSDGHLAMLRAQYFAPQRTLTASQLAAAANYRSYGELAIWKDGYPSSYYPWVLG